MKFCASTAIVLELLSFMAVKLWIKRVTTYKESSCRTRGVQAASEVELSLTHSVTIMVVYCNVLQSALLSVW
jgi:hypothetical protein